MEKLITDANLRDLIELGSNPLLFLGRELVGKELYEIFMITDPQDVGPPMLKISTPNNPHCVLVTTNSQGEKFELNLFRNKNRLSGESSHMSSYSLREVGVEKEILWEIQGWVLYKKRVQ